MLSRNIHLLSEQYIAGLREEENRRGGRFSMVGVSSNLGKVLDLSHCGVLIAKRRFQRAPVLATFPMVIRYDELKVVLVARVARKKKIKGIGKVLGLEFLEVNTDQREAIKEIIQRSRPWNAMAGIRDVA